MKTTPRDVAAAQHTTARGTAAGLVGLSGACVACGQRGVAFPKIFTFLIFGAPCWNVGHGSFVRVLIEWFGACGWLAWFPWYLWAEKRCFVGVTLHCLQKWRSSSRAASASGHASVDWSSVDVMNLGLWAWSSQKSLQRDHTEKGHPADQFQVDPGTQIHQSIDPQAILKHG